MDGPPTAKTDLELVRELNLSYFEPASSLTWAEKLSGGMQNVNICVVFHFEHFVVRIPSPDALEHGQDQRTIFNNSVAAATSGIAPECVFFDAPTGVIVTKFVNGARPLAKKDFVERPQTLALFTDAVVQLHKTPLTTFTKSKASDVIDGYALSLLPHVMSPKDPDSFEIPPKAIELREMLRSSLGLFERVVTAHNDLDPSNCLESNGRVWLIDWEWSGPGDPMADLASFSLLGDLDERQMNFVLDRYFGTALTDLHMVRLRLYSLWFGLRSGLWAHVKGGYDEYCQTFCSDFVNKLRTESVLTDMETLTHAINLKTKK